jgi:hypothetical protein
MSTQMESWPRRHLLLRYSEPVAGTYRNESSERAGIVALPGLTGVAVDFTPIWA